MGRVHEIDHPLIASKLTRMRDELTPTGEFRALLHQITVLMAFEATRDLPIRHEKVKTPVDAVNTLKANGATDIRMMNLVAAPQGIATFQEAHPDVDIFVAAIDEGLNDRAYIVPGLGDAGDRIFGTVS